MAKICNWAYVGWRWHWTLNVWTILAAPTSEIPWIGRSQVQTWNALVGWRGGTSEGARTNDKIWLFVYRSCLMRLCHSATNWGDAASELFARVKYTWSIHWLGLRRASTGWHRLADWLPVAAWLSWRGPPRASSSRCFLLVRLDCIPMVSPSAS